MMKGMISWYHPKILLITAKKVIMSQLFGLYADRRLIHAASTEINKFNKFETHFSIRSNTSCISNLLRVASISKN